MRKAAIVGDLKYDTGLDAVIDLLDVDGVCYPNTFADVPERMAVVVQYGDLTDNHMEIIDRAIELGVPVLEFK